MIDTTFYYDVIETSDNYLIHLIQLYIDGLCHGNLLEEEAINISKIFKTNFCMQPLPYEMRHVEHVICLPAGATVVRDVRVKNKMEKNSVIEVMGQLSRRLAKKRSILYSYHF